MARFRDPDYGRPTTSTSRGRSTPQVRSSSGANASTGGRDPRAIGMEQTISQFPGSSSLDWMSPNRNVGTGGAAGAGIHALLDNYNAGGGRSPSAPSSPRGGSGGGGGRSYGGGGGGGASARAAAQSNWDAVLQLLGSDMFKPQLRSTTPTAFDNTAFVKLREGAQGAATADRAAATSAYDTLRANLAGNYKNAFAGGPQTRAQSGDQSLAGLLASQGADGATYAQQGAQALQAGADADRTFGNLFAALAGNQEAAQQSRMAEASQAQTATGRNIDSVLAAMLAGVDSNEATARLGWDQQQEQLRRETEAYNQQQTQAMLAQRLNVLLPALQALAEAGLPIPDLATLGVI